MIIPEWDDCKEKADAGFELNSLELFIMDNEPAGPSDKVFRDQLARAIEWAVTNHQPTKEQQP